MAASTPAPTVSAMSGTLSKRQARRIVAAAGLGAGASLAMAGAADAANYVVGSTDDTALDGDCLTATNTDCTLRDAINDSNASTGVSDVISFKAGLSGTITRGSDLPTITDPVQINGPGADLITIDGADAHRIFDVKTTTNGAAVLMSGLTLTGGNPASSTDAPNRAGAVLNADADLSIADSVITGNTAGEYAGGIYSGCDTNCGEADHGNGYEADLTLARMTLTDNHSVNDGGGAMYLNYGSATIFSSTINGNSARWARGIGIFYMQGPVSIENSTVTGNSTTGPTGQGGGVYMEYNPSGVTIENSTVTGNSAVNGAGVYDGAEPPNSPRTAPNVNPVLMNTIVSANTGPDVGGRNDAVWDSAFSLIGSISGATINETVPGSDIMGVNDPKLGPLSTTPGGDTQVMSPVAGSPAIDKGKGFDVGVDEHGFPRPVDLPDYKNSAAAGADGSDIGAVELQTSPGGGDVVPAPPAQTPKKKKCKKKKHKRSASSAKKKCKKKKKK